MKKRFLGGLLLCLPVLSVSAESKVAEHILDNGLKVLVKEDHRSPVVVSQVWYKVGSSYEPGGITGLSHMLEHMMFKGTDKHPAGEFSRIIAENGGDENAFTGSDYTAYFQTMAASKLPVSFELEADRMRGLHLIADELKKEREVVTEERRMRTDDNPQAKLNEHFMALAYSNSPYKNPIIGWPADIANYTVEDLQAWYQRWYAPNNATVVVVGDVEPKAVFELAEKYFGPLKPSEIKPIKPQTEVEQLGVRKMTIKLPAKLPYLVLGYKVPSLKTVEQEGEAYALEVLAGVLDGGSSARLSSRLVRGKQLAVSAGAGYNLTARLSTLFELVATPAEGKTVWELESALKNEIFELQTDLISPDELQRIKAQVLASAVYERDSNFYQAMQLGTLETVGLGWKKVDEYVDKVNKVTAQQVRDVARKYLLDDHLSVAYLEPQPIKDGKTAPAALPINGPQR
ncbi:MAG: pitrilysin family protein [Methylococcaceae bacterium]|jgi:zinc protease|nr:pitrilysin family protein [Methylococcaceae bacterium]MDZ4157794.1 pitrilysin family protein [Methylococcales bacterium]MDP2392299.1 pitrilysin family protein [Methylococcaceae bacterium]MDP3021193.1 pitrilysin family protein [Methylococcaceae bacterium]MDP3391625.1 pitrilysin family protein [Methylococcaceae bacterium]